MSRTKDCIRKILDKKINGEVVTLDEVSTLLADDRCAYLLIGDDKDINDAILKICPNAFRVLKPELQTKEMVVKWGIHPNNFKYIRADLITIDLITTYLEKYTIDDYLYYKQYLTKELAEFAINKNARNIQYIDKDLITIDMCNNVVCKNGYYLQYIPSELQTIDMCISACRTNRYALEFVRKDIMESRDFLLVLRELTEPMLDEIERFEIADDVCDCKKDVDNDGGCDE